MRLLSLALLLLIALPPVHASIEKWGYETGSYVYSSPAAYGGLAFFGSHAGGLSAVYIENGTLKTIFATGGPVDMNPAIANKVVYAGSSDGYLYALDATTMQFKWKAKVGGMWQSAPLVSGGMVYVGSSNGTVYALKESDGSVVWSFGTRDQIDATPALAGNELYIASTDGKLYALDAQTGELLWSPAGISGFWTSAPVVSNGRLYIGSLDGNLYALSISKHTLLWNFHSGGAILSTPLALEGLVIFGSNDGKVYALDEVTGNEKWHFTTGSSVQGSPTAAANDLGSYTIYIGSNDNNVYALNIEDGSLKWKYDVGGWVASKPLVSGSLLIVPSYAGMVRALSTASCDFTSPEDGGEVGGSTLELAGRAWADTGVTNVEVRVNRGRWEAVSGTGVWRTYVSPAEQQGELLLECRTWAAGVPEKAPYNNISVFYSPVAVERTMQLDYPHYEVPYNSDVVITIKDENGQPLFGVKASWPGGSVVSDRSGQVVVKALSEGQMPVELSLQGYATEQINLIVGRNWLVYGIGVSVLLGLAYFAFMFFRKRS